jgi:hypothetical protein
MRRELRIRAWHYATSRKLVGSNPDEIFGFFNYSNSSSRTTAPGSTQRLTEMSTRNLPWGNGRLARKADVGASTSHNPMGLHGLLQVQVYTFSTGAFSLLFHVAS